MVTVVNQLKHATGQLTPFCEYVNDYSPVYNLATCWCELKRVDIHNRTQRERALSEITIVNNRTAYFSLPDATFVTSNINGVTNDQGQYKR